MNDIFLGLTFGAAMGAGALIAYFLLRRPAGHSDPLENLNRAQAELSGRVQSLAEMVAGRLDTVTHRIGQSMLDQTRHTAEGLSKLHERLAVIDAARQSITALSTEVIDLKAVLSSKQARGAF